MEGLQAGWMPTVHQSRYFLFEPPHHVVPARFSESVFDTLAAGYVPLITHPERLTWLDEDHYDWFVDAARQGAWIQVTSGALTGRFGKRPKYWAEKFTGEGLVHILATDAHNTRNRPPLLAEGREAAAHLVGEEEAELMVQGRTRHILENGEPGQLPTPPGLQPGASASSSRKGQQKSWFGRLFGG